MSLRRRLEEIIETARPWAEPHQKLKNTVHRRLIEDMSRRGHTATREEIEREVARILDRETGLLTRDDRARLITDIVNEALG